MTSSESSLSAWLPYCKWGSKARVRLFCLPYAGGSASIFRGWSRLLPSDIEVCPIELPGRGLRPREAPVNRLLPLACAIADGISVHLDKPFAIFGHSMGGGLGFEVCRQLRSRYGMKPLVLFAAGTNAPHVPVPNPAHALAEDKFIERLRELNGTQTAALEHPELMQLLIPLLRADFAVNETYTYVEGPPLDCPIIVLGGISDPETTQPGLQEWRQHTCSTFKLRMFPGSHFFLKSAETLLLKAIEEEISSSDARSAATAGGKR